MFKKDFVIHLDYHQNVIEYENKYTGLYKIKFLCYIFLVFLCILLRILLIKPSYLILTIKYIC